MFQKNNEWGFIGGLSRTPKKAEASKRNGLKGGRPVKGAPYKVTYNSASGKEVSKYYNNWHRAKSEAMFRQGRAYEKIGYSYFPFYEYPKV